MASGEWEPPDPQTPGQTVFDLRAELGRMDLARHLALFYRSRETQRAAAAAFIDYGLQEDYQTMYLRDTTSREDLKASLSSIGVDVDERIDRGDLAIRDASEVYLDAGFAPDRMIRTLEDACEDSLAAGYEGLCVAGENSWCFHTEQSFDHILDFERNFDRTCPDIPVVALCQYELERFSEESTAKALWTHEQIIYRNAVCENPFYIPPEEYRTAENPYLNARLMLDQMYNLAQARQQLDRREQRLNVLNRVLRHNIRNDLNAARGWLELLDQEATINDGGKERIWTAIRKIDEVTQKAERARYIEQAISDSSVESTAIGPVIEKAVRTVEGSHPDADVTVSGDTDLAVLADTNLDMALAEALTNAIVHQDDPTAAVTLRVQTLSPGKVAIDVENPGPPIPESERQAITRGYETQLDHGSGLGLWLIKWIVENAHGRVLFPDDEAGEGQIRLELYRLGG